MIRHSVIFKLKHDRGSQEEKAFLDATLLLKAIPGVLRFERLIQTSKKNNFDYGLSMEFESEKIYSDYNDYPLHKAFIENFWIKGVADFLEIDYTNLDN
jgi:hypothetical protein